MSRYSDAVAAYREKEREADKLRALLTSTQDKAMRRVSALLWAFDALIGVH